MRGVKKVLGGFRALAVVRGHAQHDASDGVDFAFSISDLSFNRCQEPPRRAFFKLVLDFLEGAIASLAENSPFGGRDRCMAGIGRQSRQLRTQCVNDIRKEVRA